MTEKEHQAQIVELVQVLGGMVYHTFDSRRSSAGFPESDHRDAGPEADLRRAEGGE